MNCGGLFCEQYYMSNSIEGRTFDQIYPRQGKLSFLDRRDMLLEIAGFYWAADDQQRENFGRCLEIAAELSNEARFLHHRLGEARNDES